MGRNGIRAFALGAGLLVGGGLAFAQGTMPEGQQEQQQQRQQAGMCPGGCPLCDAHREGIEALNDGTIITMEQQPDGAVLRFQAPAGDPQAIEDARDAAESYARALQAPETRQGCPCPRDTEEPAEGEIFP